MASPREINVGDTFDMKFTTIDSTGLPVTLAGSPAVAAYPDNSTTEITAGITLTVDFDARTGAHNVRVVATAGNGYAADTNYALMLTAGTVDGVSVDGYVLEHFSTASVSLKPTTAGRTLNVDANDRIDVGSWLGTAVTTSATSAKPEVDSFSISDVQVSADRLEAWINGFLTGAVEGTPTTTVFDTNATEATDDHFNNMIISFTGGALLGQARRITDYAGATGTFTVQPALTEAPAVADTFVVTPIIALALDENGRTDVGSWLGTAVTVGNGAPDVNIASTDDIDLSATQKASVNTEVDNALNTAIPGSPTADSINERVAAIDDKLPAGTISDFDEAADNVTLAAATHTGATIPTVTDVTNRVTANTDQINGDATAAANLEASAETIVTATAQTGSTTTVIETDLTEATDDHYIGRIVIFRTGVLADQATDITDYDGATKALTVTALTESPANGDLFVIV